MVEKAIIAAAQMNCVLYDVDANLVRAEKLIKKASYKGAKLVALPELFNTGYCVADKDYELSEPVPGGRTCTWMEEMSAKYGVYLAGAIIERGEADGVLYDTNVLTGPDGYVGKYRKVCLWGNEALRFRSGCEYPVFDIGFAKVGLQICYEVGFPEGARILTLKGADLLLYSAAFGKKRSYVWELASRARALESGAYVLACNRFGKDDKDTEFAAKSRIISPTADILEETVKAGDVIYAEIDMAQVAKQRRTVPYLRDYKKQVFVGELEKANI